MKTNIHKIGEQIKKFRELRNYTQEGVAEKLGISPQGYGKIERNEVEITLKQLQQIADILDTSIQDILGFEDKFVFNNRECQHNNIGLNNNINFQEYQKIYEGRIFDLQQEIQRLYGLLEKSLSK